MFAIPKTKVTTLTVTIVFFSNIPHFWQLQGRLVSRLEQIQLPNETEPGVCKSKRSLLASRTSCKRSMETSRNLVLTINNLHVYLRKYLLWTFCSFVLLRKRFCCLYISHSITISMSWKWFILPTYILFYEINSFLFKTMSPYLNLLTLIDLYCSIWWPSVPTWKDTLNVTYITWLVMNVPRYTTS